MQTKVKVRVDELLKAVKHRRSEIVKDYERALRKFDSQKEKRGKVIADALKKAVIAAEAGQFPSVKHLRENGEYQYCAVIPVNVPEDNEPSLSTDRIDRLIKTLEMCADETISISADDAAAYLA